MTDLRCLFDGCILHIVQSATATAGECPKCHTVWIAGDFTELVGVLEPGEEDDEG